MVFLRERDARQRRLHVVDDRTEVASTDVRVDVDPSSGLLMADVTGGRRDGDVGHVLERDLAARRGIDEQVLDVGEAAALLGDAPHDDVVGLAGVEDVADLLAGHVGGGDPPDVAWLDAIRVRLGEVDLDLDLRDADELLGVQVDDPGDLADPLLDVVREVLQDGQIRTVDPDDDRVARARQDLPDAFLEIGLDVTSQARVAVDDFQDRRVCLVVVDARVDADPVLAELDAIRFVGDERLADVGAAVAHARDLAELVARRDGHARLLCDRRAGRRHPVHQEVALLEVREQ